LHGGFRIVVRHILGRESSEFGELGAPLGIVNGARQVAVVGVEVPRVAIRTRLAERSCGARQQDARNA
jgi:hypothetical protein